MTKYFVLLMLLSAVPAQALPIRSDVIYGSDDRVDYYQMPAPFQNLAAATALLVGKASLSSYGGTTYLKSKTYGTEGNLCRDEAFWDQPTAGFCTGFLVAPDIVVTAGHCIVSAADCNITRLVFNHSVFSSGEYPTSAPDDHVYACRDLLARNYDQKGADYSVIRLDRPVSGVTPMQVRRQGALQPGEFVAILGHPSGLPLKLAAGAQVRHVQSDFFVTNVDAYGGNSGSPIINLQTGLVEGIDVRGNLDFELDPSGHCKRSVHCTNDGCRGEDATAISEVISYIP